MKTKFITLFLFICLVFTAGCELTFKRKTKKINNEDQAASAKEKMSPGKPASVEQKATKPASALKVLFSKKDADLISSYYSSTENAIIRRNMIRHSSITKKQQKKLAIGKMIPRDFQVIPLPLKLERALSNLDLRYIRVQVGANIILMNVKTRQILDIIKI